MDVLALAAALVVSALASANTPKVEAQDRQAQPVKRLVHVIDNFVVHRAAVERVRMTYHGGKLRLRRFRRRRPENRFQTARRAGNKQRAVRLFGHGEFDAPWRKESTESAGEMKNVFGRAINLCSECLTKKPSES